MADDKSKLPSIASILAAGTGRGLGNSGHSPPPPLGGLGLALLGLGRPELNSVYYNSKVVSLDGYRFVGCRFDNCTLQVSSLNFEIVQCVLDPSTRIEYSESAARVIRLFLGRYDWAYTTFHEFFVPKRNSDGTITISFGGA